jgi:hypothetical protein
VAERPQLTWMEELVISARARLAALVDATRDEDGDISVEQVTVPTHDLAVVLLALDAAESAPSSTIREGV